MSDDIEEQDGQEETRRDTISRIFKESTEANEPVETAPAEEAPIVDDKPQVTAPKETAKVRDPASGKFTKTPAAKVEPSAGAKTVTPSKEVAPVVPPVQQQPTTTALKPPQSWKPAAREKWAALPPEVQEEAVRIAKEAANAVREAAPLKQLHQAFNQTLAPYQAMLQGTNPMQAIGTLMQTAYHLRTAPPAGKAQIVANIIRDYGIPIEALAQAIDGTAPAQPSHQHFDPNSIAQQVRQQVMGEIQQQREQAHLQRAMSEVESFGQDKEFFEDVRGRMGALMQAAAEDGQDMSFDEAYDLACQMVPHVSSVVKQRQEAERVAAANAKAQKAKMAAGSIRSHPTSPVDTLPAPGEDRRADIRRAIAASRGK